MNWNALFQRTDNISPEETREMLEKYAPETFQLLDVRQPKEYEQAHIPGAKLIPLAELPDRMGELSPEKDVIVYCRSGARSQSGCQILSKAGFPRVLNMKGGIISWQGHTAGGGEMLGLEFFADGEYQSAVNMSLKMEMGLRRFYQLLADRADDEANRDLLEYMARLEDGHMAKLKALEPNASATDEGSIAEGGIDIDRLTKEFGDELNSIESILHTAMMFEAQAFDLYSRLAMKEDGELKEFYLQMAAEEQSHLKRLARELDQRLS